ncbi:TetR/AcrR family transcriptional regulator [Pseudonocardiaceae bacterium YIM PH 21723]|nr:TetR/AcrR family transcriptional regulator [Pseudonocardiaceae bacterium YIM PH 21723]
MGRPRKSASDSELPPREQILAVAERLFTEHGLTEVTMSQIAAEAGLGQSSLYYWFRRKEQLIAELLRRINRLPTEFARGADGDPAQRLWRLICFDVLTVCAFPLEITEVHRVGHAAGEEFAAYWAERDELVGVVARLIEDGIVEGFFRQVDGRLCALALIAQDESVQHWRGADGLSAYDPAQIACFLADQAVRGLLLDSDQLERVRRFDGLTELVTRR